MGLHEPKVKIKQPEGIKNLIQEYHYSKDYAQSYIDMLVHKMENYIDQKRQGKRVAPLMTLEQMETQLEIMRKFEIVEL